MSYVQVWNCIQCGRENEQTIQCMACKAYIPRDNDAVRWELRPGPLIKASSETGEVTLAHQTTKEFLAKFDHNEDIEREIPASVEAADSVLVASQKQQQILEDREDGASVISTTSDSLDSVFSVESSDTLATALTRESGFSDEQIQRAIRIFVLTLQNDELLAPLYEHARNDTRIGPNRLRRHIRGAIKTFGEQLKEEATDYLQHAASRLVQAKANYAARCIASGDARTIRSPESEEPLRLSIHDIEDSSEEETVERQVEHTGLEDLHAFRLFLTESDAYATLQADILAFCTKQSTSPQSLPAVEKSKLLPSVMPKNEMKRTWHAWQEDTEKLARSLLLGFDRSLGAKAAMFLLLDAAFLLTDDIFIALGWLEPPLEVGRTRLRSQCSCGDHFFDDLIEQRTGDSAALMQQIRIRQSLPYVKTTVVSYRAGLDIQRYTVKFSTWLHRVSSSVLALLSWQNRKHMGLPHHNVQGTAMTSGVANASNPQQQQSSLHLMACVHQTRDDTVLIQNDVRVLINDRALFQFLRFRISQRRNRLLRTVSCRSIKGIFFSKFRLSNNGSVEVRHHDPSCQPFPAQPAQCECVPPPQKIHPFPNAEYQCTLPCPLDTWPPVGPNMLRHMLKCPDKINDKSTWIFNLVPKRTTGELQADLDQPADGWGFYFQEGWDFDLIITISFVIFVLGSLLFGVCWSVFEHDIQGAFGVSAYMITACGLIVAFVVSKTG